MTRASAARVERRKGGAAAAAAGKANGSGSRVDLGAAAARVTGRRYEAGAAAAAGSVRLRIGERELSLFFDFEASERFGAETGVNDLQQQGDYFQEAYSPKDRVIKPRMIATTLWAFASRAHPELTPDECFALLDFHNQVAVREALAATVVASFPGISIQKAAPAKGEAEEEGDDPLAPRRTASGSPSEPTASPPPTSGASPPASST
jgi:hypothetical protein